MHNAIKYYMARFLVATFGLVLMLYLIFFADNDQSLFSMPASIIMRQSKEESVPRLDVFLSKIYTESIQRYASSTGLVESRPGGTVSESQAYGLIMAAGMDDKVQFDKMWGWASSSIQRSDGTFSWLWEDGQVRDPNAATDADQDIAYALIQAYERWGDEQYRTDALRVLDGMWNELTWLSGGVRYVTGGNWAKSDPSGIVINPSYLSPYLYTVFTEFDTRHDWNSLVSSSYLALNKCRGIANLPQDWCKIKPTGVTSTEYVAMRKSGDFAWEAMRVPFRIAQHHAVDPNEEALVILRPIMSTLERDWERQGKIFATYASSGVPTANYEHRAMYGSALAAFCILRPHEAKEMYQQKIITTDLTTLDFYQLAWLWFGVDFYNKWCWVK